MQFRSQQGDDYGFQGKAGKAKAQNEKTTPPPASAFIDFNRVQAAAVKVPSQQFISGERINGEGRCQL